MAHCCHYHPSQSIHNFPTCCVLIHGHLHAGGLDVGQTWWQLFTGILTPNIICDVLIGWGCLAAHWHQKLFVTFWLAEAAWVIGSPLAPNIICDILIGWCCSTAHRHQILFVTFWLAKAACVIGSPVAANIICDVLIGWGLLGWLAAQWHQILFVTFWLAEAAWVIGSPQSSMRRRRRRADLGSHYSDLSCGPGIVDVPTQVFGAHHSVGASIGLGTDGNNSIVWKWHNHVL